MNLLFEKDELVKSLTLEELSMTLTEEDITGKKKKAKPVAHYDFISGFQKLLKDYKIKAEPEEIIISKRGLRRIAKLDPKNEYVLSSIIINNLVSSFNLTSYQNDEMNMRIGIGFNESGLSVAFGTNIKLCSNMTIMGASNLIKTYGAGKVPFDKLMDLINHQLANIKKNWEFYNEIIPRLKGSVVDEDAITKLIGRLEYKAVKQAYFRDDEEAPLNISETSAFTQQLIKEGFDKTPGTYWDLFNVGTNVLTHSQTNIPSKWENLTSFGNFMLEEIGMSEYVESEILN